MKKRTQTRLSVTLVGALLILLGGSCNNSDTVAGPHAQGSLRASPPRWATNVLPSPSPTATPAGTPTPTPTPLPGAIEGDWTGTFDPLDFVDCDPGIPAWATFEQAGTAVAGILNAPGDCGFANVVFTGTLNVNTLTGTVTGGGFRHGTANGTLTGTNLEILLTSECPGILCIPGGHMHLHR